MLRGISGVFLFFMFFFEVNGIGDEYCNGFDPNNVSSTNDYHLHRVLKEGLANNSKNLYNIQKAGLKHKSDSKIACLSVRFELKCLLLQDGNCSLQPNDTDSERSIDVNGTKAVLLWSSFNASNYLGSFLLTYTKYDLRVFGFGWEDDCELYQAPIDILITIKEIPPFTKDDLCSALQYITTMVSRENNYWVGNTSIKPGRMVNNQEVFKLLGNFIRSGL